MLSKKWKKCPAVFGYLAWELDSQILVGPYISVDSCTAEVSLSKAPKPQLLPGAEKNLAGSEKNNVFPLGLLKGLLLLLLTLLSNQANL